LQGRAVEDVRREQIKFWNEHMFRHPQRWQGGGWRLCSEDVVKDVFDCANMMTQEEQEMRARMRASWGAAAVGSEPVTQNDDVD